MTQKTILDKVNKYTCIFFILFQLYTAVFGLLSGLNQRIIHLFFVLSIVVIVKWQKDKPKRKIDDVFFSILLIVAIVISIYGYLNGNAIFSDRQGVYNNTDVIFGIITVIFILEMTRRSLGPPLPILVLIFLAYAKWGNLIPGYLGHRGYNVQRIVEQLYLGYEGIYGTPLGVVSSYIALFIIFGGLLSAIGATKAYSDLSLSLVGHVRGGPAKVAVVSSALMGTISGSVIANVVATGSFSIPLMKKTGYPASFAGGVEATASCGGQFMPPVMGVAAFVMAEYLNVPYITIMKAALVPAILYFLGVFLATDLYAARLGLKVVDRNTIPKFTKVFKTSWIYLFPPVIIFYFLGISRSTVTKGALAGIFCCLIVGIIMLKKDLFKAVLNGFVESAKSIVPVALGTASAGMIIGIVSLTGLGFKLTSTLITFSGGNFFILLVLTMIAAIILGMGLPTVAAYIILATLIAPALVEGGIIPIAAHLFVFYFAVISNITPPVCLGVFAAAGIANAPIMETAVNAIKIAAPGFILPYIFVSNTSLLLINIIVLNFVYSTLILFVGITSISMGIFGYCVRPLSTWKRWLFVISGIFLFYTSTISDIIGFILFGILFVIEILLKRKESNSF